MRVRPPHSPLEKCSWKGKQIAGDCTSLLRRRAFTGLAGSTPAPSAPSIHDGFVTELVDVRRSERRGTYVPVGVRLSPKPLKVTVWVTALDSKSDGLRGSIPRWPAPHAEVAQFLVEHGFEEPSVAGSIPALGTDGKANWRSRRAVTPWSFAGLTVRFRPFPLCNGWAWLASPPDCKSDASRLWRFDPAPLHSAGMPELVDEGGLNPPVLRGVGVRAPLPASCRCGEVGRHAGFRSLCPLWAGRFDSGHRH